MQRTQLPAYSAESALLPYYFVNCHSAVTHTLICASDNQGTRPWAARQAATGPALAGAPLPLPLIALPLEVNAHGRKKCSAITE